MIQLDIKGLYFTNNKSGNNRFFKYDFKICSNGEFICYLNLNTINSSVFFDFIKLLKYSFSKLNINITSQAVLTLDNPLYHLSSQIIEFLRHHEIWVEFLPPNCPFLAPFETLFKFIKSGVRRLTINMPVNFKKQSRQKFNNNAYNTKKKIWSMTFVYKGRKKLHLKSYDLEIK